MKTPLLLALFFGGQLFAQTTTVSIIQLIANPERYDGKVVRFEGVTNIEFEGNGIYLSKEHWKAHAQSFAIWMDLNDELTKGRKWLNGKYCVVEGVYHAADRGHMGLYMGSLSDIAMFSAREPISPDEAAKLQKEAQQNGGGQPATALGSADQPALSKVQELSQARDFVARLATSNRTSKRPVVGVLTYWELRINTYAEDYNKQLERSSLYPLYYECCRAMQRLYETKPTTYLAKDLMGYPSQISIVDFEDEDFGRSHLVVGLREGNDSTGFFFLHLPGSFELKEGWKKRESWDLTGVFFDAKSPAEQTGAGQPATRPESDSEGGDKPQPEVEGRSR
jgi:hypothetical protein